MKIQALQTSFVRGEVADILFGRKDLATYQHALASLRNCYVQSQGGAKRREGKAFIDSLYQAQQGRLIAFEFNTEQIYLLAFTPGRMAVYKDDVLTVVVTEGLENLTANVLKTLNWTQSADTLILCHPDMPLLRITRTGDIDWTVEDLQLTNIPQYDFGDGDEDVISDSRGWVRSIAFKYGRFWLGGLGSRPQTILGSKSGDFFNFDVGTGLDDEALDITIDDDRVNAIVHLFPGRTLHVFTSGGEFTIAGSLGDPVTPGKIAEQLKKATLHGCSVARPVSVDGQTIFVESSGAVVRQFTYNDLEQSYKAPNVSQYAPHLIRNPQRMDVRRATADYPADYVYHVNDDGTVSVLNVLRDEDLIAWSLFETDGRVEDVAVVGRTVYWVVQRYVAGQWQRFIERLDASYLTDCAIKGGAPSQPLPSWLWLSQAQAIQQWSGAGHLDGISCTVVADGSILDAQTPSNGKFQTSVPAYAVEIGLPFLAKLKTLPANVALQGQDLNGEFKRLVSVGLYLLNSRGVEVKQLNGKIRKQKWRQFGEGVLNTPVPAFSGWKTVYLSGFDRDVQLEVTQSDPLEFHVLALRLDIGVM